MPSVLLIYIFPKDIYIYMLNYNLQYVSFSLVLVLDMLSTVMVFTKSDNMMI